VFSAAFLLRGDILKPGSNNGWVAFCIVAGALIAAVGGIFEGVVAETTFNQWYHLLAAMFLIGGSAMNMYALNEIPKIIGFK
jgi:hypothetical protein